MMAIDVAALVAILGIATWAGLPRPGSGLEEGAAAGGGIVYWGPIPGEGVAGGDGGGGD